MQLNERNTIGVFKTTNASFTKLQDPFPKLQHRYKKQRLLVSTLKNLGSPRLITLKLTILGTNKDKNLLSNQMLQKIAENLRKYLL